MDGLVERLIREIGRDGDQAEGVVGIEAASEGVASQAADRGGIDDDRTQQLLEEGASRLDVAGDELPVHRPVPGGDGGNDDVAAMQQSSGQVLQHGAVPGLRLAQLPDGPEGGQVAIEQALHEDAGMRTGLSVGTAGWPSRSRGRVPR